MAPPQVSVRSLLKTSIFIVPRGMEEEDNPHEVSQNLLQEFCGWKPAQEKPDQHLEASLAR